MVTVLIIGGFNDDADSLEWCTLQSSTPSPVHYRAAFYSGRRMLVRNSSALPYDAFLAFQQFSSSAHFPLSSRETACGVGVKVLPCLIFQLAFHDFLKSVFILSTSIKSCNRAVFI